METKDTEVRSEAVAEKPIRREVNRSFGGKSRSLCDDSSHAGACDCDSCLLGLSDIMAESDGKQPKLPVLTWSKLRSVMYLTFFAPKSFRKEWTQLGGHKGGFRQGANSGTVLKLLCSGESDCLQQLMNDILKPFVPEFKGLVPLDNQVYVEMQDLLSEFQSPSLMDCKIGLRTYLEKELAKARLDPEARHDLYEKMVEVDANEPNEEEHAMQAVTKARYMQWRESISSTCSLGFRIEGIKRLTHVYEPNCFKTVKSYEDVKQHFAEFADMRHDVLQAYLSRLRQLRDSLINSSFFTRHEVIGSSLLFVHDRSGKASVWMIDFGKTSKLPKGVTITHNDAWLEGNHEDGYLTGFDNLVRMLEDLLKESGPPNATIETCQ